MQDRLTEIEIKIAHVEQSLNEFNDVLVKQQGYIDKLQRGLERLEERLQANTSLEADSGGAGEKPPHY